MQTQFISPSIDWFLYIIILKSPGQYSGLSLRRSHSPTAWFMWQCWMQSRGFHWPWISLYVKYEAFYNSLIFSHIFQTWFLVTVFSLLVSWIIDRERGKVNNYLKKLINWLGNCERQKDRDIERKGERIELACMQSILYMYIYIYSISDASVGYLA